MARVNFSPIAIRRLSEIVEHRIKDSILKGEIEPGQKLPTERELAKQFGVSVVTAREALRALEIVGYIQRRKGKGGGIFVKELQSDPVKVALYEFLRSRKFTLRDICELRRIIEPSAARLAASQMTSQVAAVLEKNIKYCERKINKTEQTFSEKEFLDIREKNVEFHRLIAEATHNPVLALTIDYAVDFLFEFTKSLTPNIQYSIQQTNEHRRIFTRLRHGDAEAAEKEMLAHLEKAETYFMTKIVSI
jgi:GntR family transcriptional repressor for pyruvate dehydrogenase complex